MVGELFPLRLRTTKVSDWNCCAVQLVRKFASSRATAGRSGMRAMSVIGLMLLRYGTNVLCRTRSSGYIMKGIKMTKRRDLINFRLFCYLTFNYKNDH